MRRRKQSQGYQVQLVRARVVGHFKGREGIRVRPIESDAEPCSEKPDARLVGSARERSFDDNASLVRDPRRVSLLCRIRPGQRCTCEWGSGPEVTANPPNGGCTRSTRA